MLIQMRTTLIIDGELLRRAKERAAQGNLTVSEIVNRALRRELAELPAPAGPFSMVTFGAEHPPTHHEPRAFSPVEDDELRASGG